MLEVDFWPSVLAHLGAAARLVPGLALALLSALLVKGGRRGGMPLALLGAACSLTAYLHSHVLFRQGEAVAYGAVAVIIPFPYLAWLLTAWIFEDAPPAGWREARRLAALWTTQLTCFALFRTFYGASDTVVTWALLGLAVAVPFVTTSVLMGLIGRSLLRDAATDLVEARRALRLVALAAMAALVVASATSEVTQIVRGDFDREAATLVVALLASALSGVILFGALGVDASVFSSPEARAPRGETEERPATDELRAVIDTLERLMGDGLYLDPELTIGKLAQRSGFPEYKVRRAINGVLGHRNFNQYLNKYRTRAASLRLASPEDARTKVMAIALEVGFKSLASFNKAFRETYGMTPSDYRKESQATSKRRVAP